MSGPTRRDVSPSAVREFCRSASGSARILEGACEPLSTPRPLGPLADADPTTTHSGPGSSTVERDPGVRCTRTYAGGYIGYFPPGDTVKVNGKQYVCHGDGHWCPYNQPAQGGETNVGGGGVATQAP